MEGKEESSTLLEKSTYDTKNTQTKTVLKEAPKIKYHSKIVVWFPYICLTCAIVCCIFLIFFAFLEDMEWCFRMFVGGLAFVLGFGLSVENDEFLAKLEEFLERFKCK